MPVDPLSTTFARQRVLPGFGIRAQERLAAAHVLVIGAGGLGSAVLPVLAAAGVGTISVVDHDTVDETNLHRQTIHTAADVGRGKAHSAVARLAALAPDVDLDAVAAPFDLRTADALVVGVDVLVDASDNAEARLAADTAAAAHGIPLVWGSALGYSGQTGVAWADQGAAYRDLFPDADPAATPDTCSIAGVLPSVCSVIGALMANEVLKLIAEVGEPLIGRVATFDARTGRVREIAYRRDPAAAVTTRSPATAPVSATAPEPVPRAQPASDPFAITAADLQAMLAGEHRPQLVDVREPWEADIVSIPDSILIPLAELETRCAELDPEGRVVLYCHRGIRSQDALAMLRRRGFADVAHLAGGIDAWALGSAGTRY